MSEDRDSINKELDELLLPLMKGMRRHQEKREREKLIRLALVTLLEQAGGSLVLNWDDVFNNREGALGIEQNGREGTITLRWVEGADIEQAEAMFDKTTSPTNH
jgi:hypothetical protein